MKKYGYRIVISVLVYFFFRINESRHLEDFFMWNTVSTVYLLYAVAVLLFIWEVLSRAIHYWTRRTSITRPSGLYRVSLKSTLLSLPLVLAFCYIFTYHLKPGCEICQMWGSGVNYQSQFWMLSAQGFVIALLIQAHEIIRLYIRLAVQDARDKEIIQKELITARFEGLKNQVNPHFLFNSFSVLTSLVETRPEQAVEFIAKLSDMYRYILENDDKAVVPIADELAFLDDYLFLMKMRHQEGIQVERSIDVQGMDVKLPPMSLQVLVENAIKHNAFSPTDPLVIRIQTEGDRFVVVENAKKPKVELVKSTGIGLKNLSKRLMLSVKRGLEIVDEPGIFRVKLPLATG